jgi:7,8-dihydro-6-hydroxymethylpterin-pyrophosphokinase
MIGDPETRFRRIRCACCARCAWPRNYLSIESSTRAPIKRLAPLLEHVPPPRLFEEMLKLLLSGHASACLRQLRNEGLHKGLLPLLDVILDQPLGERFVTLALAQTDERVLSERPVSPAFLFAALLWHEVLAAWKLREKRGERRVPALEFAMDDVLDAQSGKLAITRRLTATMREVWSMQPRFEERLASGRTGCSNSSAFAWPTISFRCARPAAKPAEIETWWRIPDGGRGNAPAMLLPDTARTRNATPAPRQEVAEGAPPPARSALSVGWARTLASPAGNSTEAIIAMSGLPETRLAGHSSFYRRRLSASKTNPNSQRCRGARHRLAPGVLLEGLQGIERRPTASDRSPMRLRTLDLDPLLSATNRSRGPASTVPQSRRMHERQAPCVVQPFA